MQDEFFFILALKHVRSS